MEILKTYWRHMTVILASHLASTSISWEHPIPAALCLLFSAIITYRTLQDALRRGIKIPPIDINIVDNLSGEQFENLCKKLLELDGYSVQRTPKKGDLGADLIASKGGHKYSIQCKRYAGTVNRGAVSDAVMAKKNYKCNRSMVITTSRFTPDAVKVANQHDCKMIDRKALEKWIARHKHRLPTPDKLLTA